MAQNVLTKIILEAVYKDKASDKAKQTEKELKSTFGNIKTFIGGAFAAAAIYKFKQALDEVTRVGGDFEQVMANLQAISGASGAEMVKLEGDARRLGASTKYTATQVGDLQTAYSKLGFSAKEILKVTEGTLALAAATGEDLATSAEIAGGTLRAYNLDASETNRITDVMAMSFSTSALDLQKFKVAIGQSGKVSADAGLEIENTAAILGTLADNNIRAETTGTGVRNILLKMNEQGSELAKILGGNVTNFDDLIERLKTAAKDTNTFKAAQKAVGMESAVVFSTLVSNIDKLQQRSELYYTAEGSALQKAKIQMDTYKGATLELQSAMEGLSIKLFNRVEPGLTAAKRAMTAFINNLGKSQLEKTVDQLKQMGVEADKLAGLQYMVDLQKATDSLYMNNGKITTQFKEWGAKLNGDILTALGAEIEYTEISHGIWANKVKTINAAALSEKQIQDQMAILVTKSKELYQQDQEISKEDQKQIDYYNKQYQFLVNILTLVRDREAASELLNSLEKTVTQETEKQATEEAKKTKETKDQRSILWEINRLYHDMEEIDASGGITFIEPDEFEIFMDNMRATQSLFKGVGDAIAQGVIYGHDFGDAMVNSLKAIAAQVLSMAAVWALLKGLGMISGLGGASAFAGDFLPFIAKSFGFTGFADGGIATGPTLGVFGEAGAEAIIPLDQLPSIVNNISNYSDGGNSEQLQTVVSELKEMRRDLQRIKYTVQIGDKEIAAANTRFTNLDERL